MLWRVPVVSFTIRCFRRELKDARVMQAFTGWRRGGSSWKNIPREQSPNRIYERAGGTACVRAHHALVGRVHGRHICHCMIFTFPILSRPPRRASPNSSFITATTRARTELKPSGTSRPCNPARLLRAPHRARPTMYGGTQPCHLLYL